MTLGQKDLIGWAQDDGGVSIFFYSERAMKAARRGKGSSRGIEAYARIEQLLESGEASTEATQGGIYLPADDAVRLDSATRECFYLPPTWPGYLLLETHSVPNLDDFSAKLRLVDVGGHRIDSWNLRGGILKVGDSHYLPDPETYACLVAYSKWTTGNDRTEGDHLRLLHVLTEAARRGCRVDASSAGKINVVEAAEIAVDVRDESDGSISLTPIPMAEGMAELLGDEDPSTADPEVRLKRYVAKVEQRLGQLESSGDEAILRIGSTIVLLNPEQTTQARSLAREKRVPATEAKSFRRDPAQWLADHPFVHGDVEFLPRVIGIGEWTGGYLGAAGELGEKIDWFDKKPEPEKEPKDGKGSEGNAEDGTPVEPEDPPITPGRQVPLIEKNDEELRWGLREGGEPDAEVVSIDPEYSIYPRPPFPHQEEAIEWLGLHAERCGKPQRWTEEQHYWGAGALLADDMGLGKTLSTLVFLREWFLAWKEKIGTLPPACLIVSPLSLVDNWKKEIEKTFGEDLSPFTRVVQAIPAAELRDFYSTRNGKDLVRPSTSAEGGKVEQYGLMFGQGDEQSLDMPGTIVLTTYTTLRDHRFSFAGCEWSVVVLDEAHNIKNPNALQTIAAKSLKGFFRVALTGTPVENHLGDLWCLMDAVEPGALGSFSEFRSRWIHPMRQDPSKMEEIGQALREHLDALILRRTKEGALKGLPKKSIHPVQVPMTEQQAELYDEVLRCANEAGDMESEARKSNQWLASMWELRRVSLHPDLLGDAAGVAASSASASRTYLCQSGKLKWLLETLDTIRAKGEKVLIFAVQKKFQSLLRNHLTEIYGVKVPVINGDTKAIATRRSNETRLGLIEEFSESEGFGICVLSPIAAGAGLNITAANHVFHLERHWNPSKEDQATDRAYRIGQEREVDVYFPLLEHPSRSITTFDSGLNRLIDQKKNLAGSLGLIPTQPVSKDEIFREIFGEENAADAKEFSPLSVAEAARLSWELFEALIACLYEGEADQVILTPKGRDHGADVLILGHRKHGNILIQVKTTTAKKLDSEAAVRELEGAGPFYENALERRFQQRFLHTNAAQFSRRTRKAAKLYGTETYGWAWLERALQKRPLTRGQVIARNAHRESVNC